MINFWQFHEFAIEIILRHRGPRQIHLRRAISALYYGLFHDLTAKGASVFSAGGDALIARAARAYDHRAMSAVCRTVSQPRTGPLPEPFASLIPEGPGPKLVAVAKAFVLLQEARHSADYDLASTILHQDALDLLHLARGAHRSFDEIAQEPATVAFLTALLLNDRWTRRG